jgi:hypothetical protein
MAVIMIAEAPGADASFIDGCARPAWRTRWRRRLGS